MNTSASIAIVMFLAAACGGGDSKKVIVDGNSIDTPLACNPLAQTGCSAGEKCTWILDALSPQYVGHVDCVPDGTANLGEACTFGAPGSNGYDGCKKGLVCSDYRGNAGTCKQICDQQGGQPTCDAAHVCVTYTGLFSTGDTTPAVGGVCDVACNPLTDNDFDGSGSLMRRTQTCGNDPKVGCYGYPSYGEAPATGWSCTDDLNYDQGQPAGLRHRVQCTNGNNCADDDGTVYINSCNQGYLPLLDERTTVSTAICVAMCKPQNCFSGQCGVNNVNRLGVTPDACKLGDRSGTDFDVTNDADGGEHCTYLWYWELDEQNNFLPSPTSDTVGFCYDHGKYQYDSNNSGAIDASDSTLPNCGNLIQGTGAGTDPGNPTTYWGAADLGCVSSTLAGFANGKQAALKRRKLDVPRPLYRRTFDRK